MLYFHTSSHCIVGRPTISPVIPGETVWRIDRNLPKGSKCVPGVGISYHFNSFHGPATMSMAPRRPRRVAEPDMLIRSGPLLILHSLSGFLSLSMPNTVVADTVYLIARKGWVVTACATHGMVTHRVGKCVGVHKRTFPQLPPRMISEYARTGESARTERGIWGKGVKYERRGTDRPTPVCSSCKLLIQLCASTTSCRYSKTISGYDKKRTIVATLRRRK